MDDGVSCFIRTCLLNDMDENGGCTSKLDDITPNSSEDCNRYVTINSIALGGACEREIAEPIQQAFIR